MTVMTDELRHDTAEIDAPLSDLADTIEDAVGVGTLDLDTIWQIARYLTASGYTRVIPPAVGRDRAPRNYTEQRALLDDSLRDIPSGEGGGADE